ncbi:MAG: diguanylate cyclase, partial [Deltaproteobacteria bacterium]|nr:diguanylate cyclase [Deltaproteobacteria bacterium]
PPLAILDWMMPGIDGVELCRRVRERTNQLYTYIILLTAKDRKEDVVKAMDAGADDYVVKPPDPSELQARIRAGCRVIELEQRLIETQEKLKVQATHDSLTGLWNRSAIFDILDREIGRAKRNETPISIGMADLDHFKSVNDAFGHIAGDTVLREVANRMRSVIRDYDSIARYGGEEFLIVFPGLDEKDAIDAAERIRLSISEKPLVIQEGVVPVAISIGVAVMNPTTKTRRAESLIRLADEALYTAKAQGRNRVELKKE